MSTAIRGWAFQSPQVVRSPLQGSSLAHTCLSIDYCSFTVSDVDFTLYMCFAAHVLGCTTLQSACQTCIGAVITALKHRVHL